jgi:D-glycero-D-manno-heptose 1,7-bisphosphate phosphatase
VFLDRDGTIIEHVHHLRDTAHVRLLPGAGDALRRIEAMGFSRIVVTNQSVVGRGWISSDELDRIHAEVQRQLAVHGASLDAFYYCPLVPVRADSTQIEHRDRKPGPGMLLHAADELALDLSASWMIGDAISDVLAGLHAGCRGSILVRTGLGFSYGDGCALAAPWICDDLPSAAEVLSRASHDGYVVDGVPSAERGS